MDSFNKLLQNKFLVHKLEKSTAIDKWTFLKSSKRHVINNKNSANIVVELEKMMQQRKLNGNLQYSKKMCRKNRIQLLQKGKPILQRNRFSQPVGRRLITNRECINVSENLLKSVSFDVGFLKPTINTIAAGNFLPEYTSTPLPIQNDGKVPFQPELEKEYNEFVSGIGTTSVSKNKTLFGDCNTSNYVQNQFNSAYCRNNHYERTCSKLPISTGAAGRSAPKSLDILQCFDIPINCSRFRDPVPDGNLQSLGTLEDTHIQTFDDQFPLNTHEESFFDMPNMACPKPLDIFQSLSIKSEVQNKESFFKMPEVINEQKSFGFQDFCDSHNVENRQLFFNSEEFDFSPFRSKNQFMEMSSDWTSNRPLLKNDHQEMYFDLSECLNMFNSQSNLEEIKRLQGWIPTATQFESVNCSSVSADKDNSSQSPCSRASPTSDYSVSSPPKEYLPCNEILNKSMQPNATAAIRSAEREILDPPNFKYKPRDVFKINLWK